jgi:hypothetical protein
MNRNFRKTIPLPKINIATMLILFCFSCGKDYTPNPDERSTATIQLIYGKDEHRTVTPHVIIYLNGMPVDVVFDTGSSGLRLLNGALNTSGIDTTSTRDYYGYGDLINRTAISGLVAGAKFSLAKDGYATPLRFMLIENVKIGSEALTDTRHSATTAAAVFRGLNGIMGVGMRLDTGNNGIASPLAQLPGANRFIVELPAYGGASGTLIINPNSADIRGFQPVKVSQGSFLLPNGLNSYKDNNLPGSATLNGVTFIAPTLLDTGNPLVWVDSSYFDANHLYLKAGGKVQLAVGEPLLNSDIITVTNQYSGQDWIEENDLPRRNSFGIQFFFMFDVMIDQQQGIISIRKK